MKSVDAYDDATLNMRWFMPPHVFDSSEVRGLEKRIDERRQR